MKIFVFDTETTGLFNKKETDLNKLPYIVQFSGILAEMEDDGSYEEIDRVDILIKPPIDIPVVTSEIHGIYNIDVKDKNPFKEEAKQIIEYINNADFIVGHNIEFDENVIKTEIARLKMEGIMIDYNPKNVICTMNESINYCRLPRKSGNGFKRPKLQELTKKTLGTYFHGAHNAINDCEATLGAFSVLVKEGIIKLNKTDKLTLF